MYSCGRGMEGEWPPPSPSERLGSYAPSDGASRLLLANTAMYSQDTLPFLPFSIPSRHPLLLPHHLSHPAPFLPSLPLPPPHSAIPSLSAAPLFPRDPSLSLPNPFPLSHDTLPFNPNILPRDSAYPIPPLPPLLSLPQDLGLPIPGLGPQLLPRDLPSRKRALEGQVDYGKTPAEAAKRAAMGVGVEYRLLALANRIGKLIGKQGARIQQLREETGANIKISEPDPNSEDRLITISSKEESEPSVAEHALLRVASFIILEHGDDNVLDEMGPEQLTNLTRLLIAHFEAGILIGKGGETIESIRDSSGASVRILSSDQLPKSSFASPTDRLVQISGDSIQVQKALAIVASKLRGNVLKDDMLNLSTNTGGQQLLYDHVGFPQNKFMQQVAVQSAAPKIITEMTVQNALIGGVIGKGGAKITQIRTLTGCVVKVSKQKAGKKERKISFEGTPEQVVAARSIVQVLMEDK